MDISSATKIVEFIAEISLDVQIVPSVIVEYCKRACDGVILNSEDILHIERQLRTDQSRADGATT